jgi:acetyl-CoA carboxylase biotin carboxyl carrier protein
MSLTEIENLIKFIAQLGLEEVSIETDQFKLSVRRSAPKTLYEVPSKALVLEKPADSAPTLPSIHPDLSSTTPPSAASAEEYITIKSPMIGTFYRAPSPNKPPFVQEGETIKKGQPLCVIEAMKLFNEIEAEAAGILAKVLIEDASPVEYDQPLFLIKPLTALDTPADPST